MTGTQLSDLPYELVFKILRFTTSYDTLKTLSSIPEFSSFIKNSTVVIRISIDDEVEQNNIRRFYPVIQSNDISSHIYELRLPKNIFRNENIELFPLILQHTDILNDPSSKEISFLSLEVFITNEQNKWDQVFQYDILERLNISSLLRLYKFKIRILNVDLYSNKSSFVPYGYQRLQSFQSKEDTFLYTGYHKLHPLPYLVYHKDQRRSKYCTHGVHYDASLKSLNYTSAGCLNKNTTNLCRASFAIPKISSSSGFKYAFSSGEDWIEPSVNVILYNRSTEPPLSAKESARGLTRVVSYRSSCSSSSSIDSSCKEEDITNSMLDLVHQFNNSYYQAFKSFVLGKVSKKRSYSQLSPTKQDLLLADILLPKPYSDGKSNEETEKDLAIYNISKSYFGLFDILYNKSQRNWKNQRIEFIKIRLYLDGVDTNNVLDQVLRQGTEFIKEVLC